MLKKILFTIIALFIGEIGFSQSYLGWVNKQVNFREQPDKTSPIISSLKAGTQIFIVSTEAENDFFNVIDIASNEEGYIHKSFIKLGEIVQKNEGGLFSPEGTVDSYNPEVEIYNRTSKTLTLKLNREVYSFTPNERRTITLTPGGYDYRASAAGVLPNIGNEFIKSNMKYSWEFYIQTKYGY